MKKTFLGIDSSELFSIFIIFNKVREKVFIDSKNKIP